MKPIAVQFSPSTLDVNFLEQDNARLRAQIETMNRELEQYRLLGDNGRLSREQTQLCFDKIILVCANVYQVTPQELTSRSRICNVVWARQLAISIYYETCGITLKQTGDIFGFDHKTVMESISAVKKRRDYWGMEEKEKINKARKILGLPV